MAADDGSGHPAVELMFCLFILISAPHSDEIAVIMWQGYSTSNASFGSCRSSPLLESLFSLCVCIPSALLGRRFPGFGFLWLSMLSSLSRLSESFFSNQRRTIIIGTMSIAFACPLYKCAEMLHHYLCVRLCVNGCQKLSRTKCMQVCNKLLSANQSTFRELSHALTCPDWANSDWEWCPFLRYWLFHPLRQHQPVSLSLPRISCTSLFWLDFSWLCEVWTWLW